MSQNESHPSNVEFHPLPFVELIQALDANAAAALRDGMPYTHAVYRSAKLQIERLLSARDGTPCDAADDELHECKHCDRKWLGPMADGPGEEDGPWAEGWEQRRAADEPSAATDDVEAYIDGLDAPQLRNIIRLHRKRFDDLRKSSEQWKAAWLRDSPPPSAPLTPHGQALLDEAASLIRQIGRELDWGPGVKGETWRRINAFIQATPVPPETKTARIEEPK